MKKRIKALLFLPLYVSLITSCGPSIDNPPIDNNDQGNENIPTGPLEKHRTIDIYNINDFHGAFTYDQNEYQTGFGRIGNFLKSKKDAKKDDTIILSTGDMWQGGVESNKTKGNLVADAMNIVGFDAMAIGNHEFDWDEDAIIANDKIMNFPLISSNIFYEKDHTRPSYLTPSITLNKGGVKVGIIGAGSQDLGSDILGTISQKFVFEDPVPLIQEESDKLKSKGCDLILLATHDGGFDGRLFKFSELTRGEDPAVDAIFLGHDHRSKKGERNGVPYIEGGSNGRNVSNIRFELELDANNKYQITSKTYDNIVTFNNPLFETSLSAIDNLLEKYKDVIGDVNRVIYEFEKSISKSKFLEIVTKSIHYYINKHQADLGFEVKAAFHNDGGIRSEVYSGPFTYKDLIKVCPFDNKLVILKVDQTQYNYLKNNFGPGSYIPTTPDFSNGYTYVGTINYVSESQGVTAIETKVTNIVIQDAIEYYLVNNPGLY